MVFYRRYGVNSSPIEGLSVLSGDEGVGMRQAEFMLCWVIMSMGIMRTGNHNRIMRGITGSLRLLTSG
jgi:hypothetical protein